MSSTKSCSLSRRSSLIACFIVGSFGMVGARVSQASQTTVACSPNTALHETAEDCPWAQIARVLQASDQKSVDLAPFLFRSAPQIGIELEMDSRNWVYKALWGSSINQDAGGGQIVDPRILEAIGELGQVQVFRSFDPNDPSQQIMNAGFAHTYGYLFSTLLTPYGYKRSRWVADELETGFGLPAGLLGPTPREGTLFQNVSYFAGKLAFRSNPAELRDLESFASEVPRELRDFSWNRKPGVRLSETVVANTAGGGARTIVIRTDLVPFSFPVPEGDYGALVYSVEDPALGGARLVTLFPAAMATAKSISNPNRLGALQPISTQYNAYIDGITGQSVRGTRALESSCK